MSCFLHQMHNCYGFFPHYGQCDQLFSRTITISGQKKLPHEAKNYHVHFYPILHLHIPKIIPMYSYFTLTNPNNYPRKGLSYKK